MKKHPCLRTCVVALLTVTLSVACVPSALALAEGDAAQRKDIIFLEPLPLFFH